MTSLDNYDTTVYIQTNRSIWINTFYFQMVENSNEPKFKYNNTNILSISEGYNNDETTYSPNKIVDISSTTVTNFINKLASYVFGSDQTTSFFSNISSVRINIQDSLELAAANINTTINGNGTTYTTVTNLSNTGYKTAKDVYDDINNNTDRLKLHYTVQSTGATLPVSSTISNFIDSVNSGIVTVTTDSSGSISEIVIGTTGSNYTKGDTVTFTNSSYTINYSSITSYQASALNGTLYTSNIEYPFEVNDIMDIASTIKSSTAQLDASDDNVSMETVVRYRIKLV